MADHNDHVFTPQNSMSFYAELLSWKKYKIIMILDKISDFYASQRVCPSINDQKIGIYKQITGLTTKLTRIKNNLSSLAWNGWLKIIFLKWLISP